jgi:transposase-like protein
MGLSSSEQDLDRVAAGMIEELELRNSRPLPPDMLAVFVDGKYVELRDGDKLRSACIYLVIGLSRDGKKSRAQLYRQAGPGESRRLESGSSRFD